MKQRIFSHFQDYLIQYISHQYQDLLYCNSSQYILSTYNSQHNNNNNVVLAMTMPYSGQGWRHIVHSPSGRALCLQPWSLYLHYYINILQNFEHCKNKSEDNVLAKKTSCYHSNILQMFFHKSIIIDNKVQIICPFRCSY